MSIKSVAHVCLKSTDLNATADFYCGALGMKKVFDFIRQGKVIGFYMKAANETFIEVFLTDEVEKIGKQVLNHFCLEVDSIEAVRKSLIDRGYTVQDIKMGCDNSHQFWMKDPNGLDVEFQEYTDQSLQRLGGVVEVNW